MDPSPTLFLSFFFPFSSFSNMTRKKGPALYTLSLVQGILGKPIRQYGGIQRMHKESNPSLGKEALLLHTFTTVGKS